MAELDLGKVVGSKLHNVTAAPAASLGLVNDWAIVTAAGSACGDLYEKTGESTWTQRGSLKGPQGEQGARGSNGTNGSNGADGKTPALSINAAGHLIATYSD